MTTLKHGTPAASAYKLRPQCRPGTAGGTEVPAVSAGDFGKICRGDLHVLAHVPEALGVKLAKGFLGQGQFLSFGQFVFADGVHVKTITDAGYFATCTTA